MNMSENISQLATALSKAQGEIDDATKRGLNPAFRSKYADLAAVRGVIREPLAVNDLCIVQFPRTVQGGVEVETMIVHKSGEFMSEALFMPVSKYDAHGIGSGITYARRYGLMSLLCLAADDDDGNAAVEKSPAKDQPKKDGQPKQPLLTKEELASLAKAAMEAAKGGTPSFADFWKILSKDERAALNADPEAIAELKEMAQTADKEKTDENV
jgi:hypothetical protein